MQEAPLDPEDRTTDTGMLRGAAEDPGPGRSGCPVDEGGWRG
jgi:hypothetical protein